MGGRGGPTHDGRRPALDVGGLGASDSGELLVAGRIPTEVNRPRTDPTDETPVDSYSREERGRLTRMALGTDALSCPRCGGPMDRRAIPPRSDVSYVRDRIWLVCGGCSRSLVIDRARAE